MRYGILFNNKKRRPLQVAIKMAVAQFNNQSHTRDYYPAEARFNPANLPPEKEIQGLSILPDRRIPVNHIRICTHDFPDRVSHPPRPYSNTNFLNPA